MSSRAARAVRRIERFALSPARAEPLAALRIGLASVLLVQAALVAPSYRELYGRAGLVSGPLREMMRRPGMPHLDVLLGVVHARTETSILAITGVVYVAALAALLVGLRTRLSAALSWFLHMALLTTGAGTNYGADRLAHVFLFYAMAAPSGAAISLDRILAHRPSSPSSGARLALRVAQIHLALVYLTSGLTKAWCPGWRDGDVIWRVLTTPEYARFGFDFSWLAGFPLVAVVAGWTVLAVEVGYAALIWPKRTRRLWIAATLALHLGIIVFMGLVLFGAIMIVLTVALFGVDAEPSAGGSAAPADAAGGQADERVE
jgi:hypothetical protein